MQRSTVHPTLVRAWPPRAFDTEQGRLLELVHFSQGGADLIPICVAGGENASPIVPITFFAQDGLDVDEDDTMAVLSTRGKGRTFVVLGLAHYDLDFVGEFLNLVSPLVNQVGGRHDEGVALVGGSRSGEDQSNARGLFVMAKQLANVVMKIA